MTGRRIEGRGAGCLQKLLTDRPTGRPSDCARRVTAEAEQRLLAVCRAVVVQAASDAWAAHEAATTAAAAAAGSASPGAASAVRSAPAPAG